MNIFVASDTIEGRTAWVFDDKKSDEQRLIGSLEAVGIHARGETNIAAIEVSVQEIVEGGTPPSFVILDQHWDTHLESLEPIGRADLPIESPHLAGRAIALYLRGFDELKDTLLVMVSGLDEPMGYDDLEIGPVISLDKGDMDDFGARLQSSIATDPAPTAQTDVYATGARKFLSGFAAELGIPQSQGHLLLGGERGSDVQNGDALDMLLASSRDAKKRVKVLIDIAVLLHARHGRTLPPLEQISSDLGVSIREALLEGDYNELLQIKFSLEARGGGTLDR